MGYLLKKTALLGMLAVFCLAAWGQSRPYSKKKSSFQAPLFYVKLAKDTAAEKIVIQPVEEVAPLPVEDIVPKPAEEVVAQPIQTEVIVSLDSVGMALQNAKLDSLNAKLEAVHMQLTDLQAAYAASTAKKDTLYVIDVIDSMGVTPKPMLLEGVKTATPEAYPDYSDNFSQLNQQFEKLQAQLATWEKKMAEVPPATPPTQLTQPVETTKTAKIDPPETKVVADPKLQEAVDSQTKQVKDLEDKLDRYALNNSRGIDDLRKANRDLTQQLNELILLQDTRRKTSISPVIAPQTVEVVVPQDTALARQLADIQRQLATRQDTSTSGPDTILLQQFTQLNTRLTSLQQDQQAQQITITRLRQSKDSLEAQLATISAQEPVIQIDTVVQIQTQTETIRDTIRLKTEVLGLQKTNIYFQKGSSNLFDADLPVLEKLAKQLATYPDLKLYIRGFADNLSGGAATNLRLSEERAQKLKAFFVGRGVDVTRLIVEAYGSQAPVYKNSLDRRVELEIVGEK